MTAPHIPRIPDALGTAPNVLPVDAGTTPDYPTRCRDCNRPVHTLARFPGGRCLDCHAASNPPMPSSGAELARMWGATS